MKEDDKRGTSDEGRKYLGMNKKKMRASTR
jgi:hypothetical protein